MNQPTLLVINTMAQKRNLCDACGQLIKKEYRKGYCSKECSDQDTEEDQDFDFECCEDCDLPDACEDFGCAIKAGLREPSTF